MPPEDEPYYSRRPRTAALSHNARTAATDVATGSLSYGSNVHERSMIWQLAPQPGQSIPRKLTPQPQPGRRRPSMPLLYPIAFHCRPYQKPTRALYALTGLAILWPGEEGPRSAQMDAEERPRWCSHAACPQQRSPIPHCMPQSSDPCATVPGLGRLSSPHSLSLGRYTSVLLPPPPHIHHHTLVHQRVHQR